MSTLRMHQALRTLPKITQLVKEEFKSRDLWFTLLTAIHTHDYDEMFLDSKMLLILAENSLRQIHFHMVQLTASFPHKFT